jgi:hypothetical protein
MSLQTGDRFDGRESPSHPIAVEFGLVTAALVGVYLWRRLSREVLSLVFGSPAAFDGLLIAGLVTGGFFVAGVALFVALYAAVRDIDVGLRLPSRADLRLVGVAAVVPVALVGLTKLVGVVTGVSYGSLTKTAYAADAPATPVLLVTGLGLVVGVPVLVAVCQVLVQGSFRRVLDGGSAVALTTFVTGFVAVSDTGGLTAVPDRGTLAGAVLFALLLGGGLYARDRVDGDRLRLLSLLPVLLFAALVVLSGVAAIQSVAGGLFALTHLAVLGLAAATYERTGSLAVPAVAYASLSLVNRLVVYVFEAGVQHW